MEYCINNFSTHDLDNSLLIYNKRTGIKLKSEGLKKVITYIKDHHKFVISEKELKLICDSNNIDYNQASEFMVNKLNILIPKTERMFEKIILNVDDKTILNLLEQTFVNELHVEVSNDWQYSDNDTTLTLFYRNNYSSPDYKQLYASIKASDYIITAGNIASTLVIDNIYFKNSGLPSHFSSLNNVITTINSSLSITKNNWLLFYRELVKNDIYEFPEPDLNTCQKSYVTYCLYRFIRQFTNFSSAPTTLDSLNWFWHVSLENFEIFKEVATHSPYSEVDMNLNIAHECAEKMVG